MFNFTVFLPQKHIIQPPLIYNDSVACPYWPSEIDIAADDIDIAVIQILKVK